MSTCFPHVVNGCEAQSRGVNECMEGTLTSERSFIQQHKSCGELFH